MDLTIFDNITPGKWHSFTGGKTTSPYRYVGKAGQDNEFIASVVHGEIEKEFEANVQAIALLPELVEYARKLEGENQRLTQTLYLTYTNQTQILLKDDEVELRLFLW